MGLLKKIFSKKEKEVIYKKEPSTTFNFSDWSKAFETIEERDSIPNCDLCPYTGTRDIIIRTIDKVGECDKIEEVEIEEGVCCAIARRLSEEVYDTEYCRWHFANGTIKE